MGVKLKLYKVILSGEYFFAHRKSTRFERLIFWGALAGMGVSSLFLLLVKSHLDLASAGMSFFFPFFTLASLSLLWLNSRGVYAAWKRKMRRVHDIAQSDAALTHFGRICVLWWLKDRFVKSFFIFSVTSFIWLSIMLTKAYVNYIYDLIILLWFISFMFLFVPLVIFGIEKAGKVFLQKRRDSISLKYRSLPGVIRQSAQHRAHSMGLSVEDVSVMSAAVSEYEKDRDKALAQANALMSSTPQAQGNGGARRL